MCEAAAAATGQCSPRGFGDGLRMPGARARSVFDRASVHSAHRTTNKGYVTVNQGKDAMACIHAPNGAGICWPGGKTGYNEVRSESTQVDHLSRSRRILTCLVCLSVRAACHVSVMPGRQHITRKAQVTPGGSRDHGDASKLPGVARRILAKLCDNLHQNVHTATSVGPFRPRSPSSPCTEHNKNVPLTKRIPQRAPLPSCSTVSLLLLANTGAQTAANTNKNLLHVHVPCVCPGGTGEGINAGQSVPCSGSACPGLCRRNALDHDHVPDPAPDHHTPCPCVDFCSTFSLYHKNAPDRDHVHDLAPDHHNPCLCFVDSSFAFCPDLCLSLACDPNPAESTDPLSDPAHRRLHGRGNSNGSDGDREKENGVSSHWRWAAMGRRGEQRTTPPCSPPECSL